MLDGQGIIDDLYPDSRVYPVLMGYTLIEQPLCPNSFTGPHNEKSQP
jgi:hypothetical protein